MSESNNNILNGIMPRLIAVTKADAILALEVIQGPYTGVTFSFKTFTVAKERLPNGMVPTQFETRIHQSPPDFVSDEAFDEYCSEVLLAWLHFISIASFDTLIKTETSGVH